MAKLSTNRFLAEMLRGSYYDFFLHFWSEIAAEKLNEAWYIRKLCDELQAISERVFNNEYKEHDLIWNCPPGTSKSSIVSILWQPWVWTRMPSARFITGSHSEKLALDLSRKSRDVVLSDRYQSLYPEIKLRDDQNTKSHFENTRGGMRYACGVGGSVIGKHAHFIAVDDPIDPQGVLSDLVLAEANHWKGEVLSRRKVNLLLTPTVLIMQRLHQNDPTGDMVERVKRLKHYIVPCDTTWEVKPESLKQFYVDGLLDPIRLSQPALDDALDELLVAGFASQYGQSPVPRGGAMFQVDRFNYSSTPPTRWKRGPVRFYDKAATAKAGAFTVGVKGALDYNDKVWVLDVLRGQWDSGTRERQILATAYLDGKQCRQVVEQEPGGSGKESAESTVKRLTLAGFRASMVTATGDKELRADPFSEHVNMGNVVLVNALWNRAFVEEYRYFPRSKYKDQVDAGSGMFSQLVRRQYKIGAL